MTLSHLDIKYVGENSSNYQSYIKQQCNNYNIQNENF